MRLWMLVATVVVMYCYVERGGNQYGPRFHYEAFLFTVIFVVANLFRRAAWSAMPPRDRRVFACLLISVALMPVAFAAHARTERAVIVERMDPFTRVRAAGLHDALVLMADRVGSRRSIAPADLTRNGIDNDASVLFGIDQGDDRPCDWARRVPRRRPYVYAWDHTRHHGTLSELACADSPRP